jgi:predicted RNA-binding protein YlqC (UPF0109 family)
VRPLADVSSPHPPIKPNYVALVRFLLEPLLESPNSLKVDSEVLSQGSRVLIRVAFEGEDKGRAFGRGGRNVQAIRTIVQAIGQLAHQRIHLEVFGGYGLELDDDSEGHGSPSSPRPSRGSRPSRPPMRSRPRRPR